MAHPVESLEIVANLLPEPMLLVRADGVIESGNAAFANAFGHPMRGLAARRLAELTLPGPEPLADYLRRCASTRQLVLGAITVRHSGGAEIPCRCEGAALIPATDSDPALVLLRFIPKDQSVSRFVALTQKIEQLSAEISRRLRAEQLLLQERELLAVTLTSIGDGVITTDAKGRVTFMNRSAESLTGWTLVDARDRPMDEVFHVVDEETRAPVENPAAKVLTSGTTVGMANHAILMARDGHECAVDDSAAPIVDADGRLHGVVLVFRDVTDLRRAQRQERAARRAAESANHAKDRFLATLSHELRTPLNAILGWSRMLIRGTVGGERRRHGLVVIERNAELQARLVEDLLDVSRITTGKLRLRSDVVDVDDLIEAAVDSIRPAANAKGSGCR